MFTRYTCLMAVAMPLSTTRMKDLLMMASASLSSGVTEMVSASRAATQQ